MKPDDGAAGLNKGSSSKILQTKIGCTPWKVIDEEEQTKEKKHRTSIQAKTTQVSHAASIKPG